MDTKLFAQLTPAQRADLEAVLAATDPYGPPAHAVATCLVRGVKPAAIVAAWNEWLALHNGDGHAAQTYGEQAYGTYLYAPLLFGKPVVPPGGEPSGLGKLTINENEIVSRTLHPTKPTESLGQPVDVAQRNAFKAFLLALTLRDQANVADQARAAFIFTPAATSTARAVVKVFPDTYGAYMRLLGSTSPSSGLAGFHPLGQYLYLTGKLNGFYGFTWDPNGTITGQMLLQRRSGLDGNEIRTLPDGREVPKSLSAYARDVCKVAVSQNPGTRMPDDDGIELG